MARRIEICVPREFADDVREVLASRDKCDLGDDSSKPGIIVEVDGRDTTVFTVTVPSGAISSHLEMLRNAGLGSTVGTVALLSLDALKPRFNKGLIIPRRPGMITTMKAADGSNVLGKASSLQGFKDFQKARLTTEEIYNTILGMANMTLNTWVNLIGASVIAVGGLASNATVFIVASMLVSPIMGPIMGMTFGYRIADWGLFKTGVINEIKMAFTAWIVGALCGLIIGSVGKTYNWPTSAMQTDGQAFALIISVMVSAAAGAVLAVTITSGGVNSLVGTAISAGLLPPLVNSGMLCAYAGVYAPPGLRNDFYEMGLYAIIFYMSHVFTIFVVANTVFWLKEIDPRFSSSEDSNYSELPSVAEAKKRSAAGGNFFLDNMQSELAVLKEDFEDFGSDIKNKANELVDTVKTGVGVGSHQGHSRERRQSEVDIESSGRQPLSQRSEEERGALTSAADRHRVRQAATTNLNSDSVGGYADKEVEKTRNPMFDFL